MKLQINKDSIFNAILFLTLIWASFHYGFISGYEDATNDHGYRFNQTVRAFK